MAHPPYTQAEANTRETFLALMWALSYPGRVYELPRAGQNFALIADALLDLETSYYSPDADLNALLARTGAKALPVDQAAYHFYPALGQPELVGLREANVGTSLYPDQAATLFFACSIGSGTALTLTGPGVNGSQRLHIGGIPDAFWTLRESAGRFPLGWDVYFVDGFKVVGLPRTTRVERD